MKSILLVLVLLSSQAFALRTVLVTAFDGFAGESVNWSYNVALKLKESKSRLPKDVEIQICQVPTVYDQGAEKAKDCFDKMALKPEIVLSMGEGGCHVDLETAAHNRDQTPGLKDNAGVIRAYSPIDSKVAVLERLGYPIDRVLCSAALTEREKEFTQASASPGGFVCNNLAFHLAGFFKEKNIPYQFIHIPSHKCVKSKKTPLTEKGAISEATSIVLKMINSELVEAAKTPGFNATVPTELSAIRTEIEKIKESKDAFDQCRRSFLDDLYQKRIAFIHSEAKTEEKP